MSLCVFSLMHLGQTHVDVQRLNFGKCRCLVFEFRKVSEGYNMVMITLSLASQQFSLLFWRVVIHPNHSCTTRNQQDRSGSFHLVEYRGYLVVVVELQGIEWWLGRPVFAPSMKGEEMEGKITELMVGIRDVRANIRRINVNFSWMNSPGLYYTIFSLVIVWIIHTYPLPICNEHLIETYMKIEQQN